MFLYCYSFSILQNIIIVVTEAVIGGGVLFREIFTQSEGQTDYFIFQNEVQMAKDFCRIVMEAENEYQVLEKNYF